MDTRSEEFSNDSNAEPSLAPNEQAELTRVEEPEITTDHTGATNRDYIPQETVIPVVNSPSTPHWTPEHSIKPSLPVDNAAEPVRTSRRFLVAYVTTIFSALSLLASGSWLGYVLVDYFLKDKSDTSSFYFDMAPIYISLMSTMIVFGLVYFVTSQYVARAVERDQVNLRDWRVYRVIYALFTAILVTAGASVLASFVYIPIAMSMVAEDMTWNQINTQLLGGVVTLLLIGLLIWGERLVKKGKKTWLQSLIVLVALLVLVVLTAIFPVGGKTDARYDARAADDLSSLEMAVNTYKTAHDDKLPASLSDLDLSDKPTLQQRLSRYSYTQKDSNEQKTKQAVLDYLSVQGTVGDNTGDGAGEYDSLLGKTTPGYQLCAKFRTDTTKSDNNKTLPLFSGSSSGTNEQSFTKHAKGSACFDRN